MNATTSSQKAKNEHLKLVENLVLLFIFMFSTHFLNQYWHLKLVLITTLIVAHFTNYKRKFPTVFWGLTIILTSLDFINNYFYTANHTFVLFYLTFLIGLTYFYPLDRIKILKRNSISMVILILFFSAIQKLLSPEFMNGNYIGFTTLKGDLFVPFRWPYNFSNLGNQNMNLINEKLNEVSNTDVPLKLLIPFHGFETFSIFFSYFVILSEFLMIPVLLLKNLKLKNTISLLFVVGLLLTRLETGFISLLVILLIAQLPPAEKTFRLMYLGIFAVCVGLILVRIGLY